MSPEPTPQAPPTDDAIGAVVARLARPHPRGVAVERAAILAAGVDATAIIEWVLAHGGEPESTTSAGPSRGLHGGRGFGGSDEQSTTPQRYVLPARALDRPSR